MPWVDGVACGGHVAALTDITREGLLASFPASGSGMLSLRVISTCQKERKRNGRCGGLGKDAFDGVQCISCVLCRKGCNDGSDKSR